MSMQIPGFGVFNKPLPEFIDHCTDTAVSWIKNKVTSLTAETPVVEAEAVPEAKEEVVVHKAADASLAINLATSHSVVLEQTLKEIAIPDTSGDEALARNLAQKFAQEDAPVATKPIEVPRPTTAPKPIERPKVEEKKESSVFSTSQVTNTDKRKSVKDRHHHHRSHHGHKKIQKDK